MQFELSKSVEILERTPKVVKAMLDGLSDDWIRNNEGPETWSAYDIVGHLIHGEKTDWIQRIQIVLSDSADKKFTPFDRFAQKNTDQKRSIEDLILEFSELRKKNLMVLKALNITSDDLDCTGIHPDFGKVTLGQLLSTWAVHDLGHLAQISRVMAKQYIEEVGPWENYLGILRR